jgi:PAS domain S-box-containing protein
VTSSAAASPSDEGELDGLESRPFEVLVVDDDAAMAGSVVEILALSGITAAGVTSASAAILHERHQHPGVVICDQRLPDMSGLDLCAAIRAIDPDVFLILLTGHASLDTAIAAVGQIDQYLTKPAPPEDLVNAVRAGAERNTQRRTERRNAEQAATRLAAIIEGTDDAVIAMTLDGTITGWNRGAEAIYGYPADHAIGQPAAILVPPDQPDDLPDLLADIRAGKHVEHFETIRMRADATNLHVSLTVSPIHDSTGNVIGASSIARDITDRLAADELRQQLDGSAARQAQAFQINDSIVQHLVVAQGRLQVGDMAGAAAAVDEGLVRARGLIDDLLPEETDSPPASSPVEFPASAVSPAAVSEGTCTVLLADDSQEIRVLVRMLLELADGFTVVAEAADGHEAISAAETHRPDLVLLDHSMPNLDGLSALPTIREVSPDSTVVMLSGFSAERLSEAALASGAAAYISKANLASDVIPELQRIMKLDADGSMPERDASRKSAS